MAPGAADAGATEDHGGGGRGGWGGGSNAGENAGGGDLPPPSTTTVARRMNETTILLEELGRGGGGTVHKALHVPSMRLVAVKIMQVHDDEKRNQLIRELKTLNSMARVSIRWCGRCPRAGCRSGWAGAIGCCRVRVELMGELHPPGGKFVREK